MSGIYTGAMGIMSHMTKLDVIANNIANSQTTGYKTDKATFRVFEETHMIARSRDAKQNIGAYQHMVHADDIRTNFQSGLYEMTDNPLEVAIVDKADAGSKSFFVVQKGGETFLTRNGQFTLDADRRLSTFGGELVMGQDGNPLTLPEGQSYSIGKNGEVRTTRDGTIIGTIQAVSVQEEHLVFLQKEKGSLFSVMTLEDMENRFGPIERVIAEYDQNITYQKMFGSKEILINIMETGQVDVVQPGEGDVQSSMIEGSNVQLTEELLGLMEAQRGVQSSQKVWQTMSEVLEWESQKIGS